MRIGEKIRTLRELKNITAKDMAAELDMTQAGYLKIERDEVDINTEKIEKISAKLGLKPHELLMEEKYVYHITNNNCQAGFGSQVNNYGDPKFLELLEKKLKLLEDMNKLLEDKITNLTSENNKLKQENDLLKDN